VLFEHLLVDARDVVVALQVCDRRQLYEILEAVDVLREQREVVARFAAFLHGAVGPGRRRDVGFIANDRIEPGVLALLVELDSAEEMP